MTSPEAPGSSIGARVRAALEQLEVDHTVVVGLMSRFWTFAAAPVTAALIATQFTPVLQGYYYTFASLLAIKVFVELGLGTVIVQFVAHEWSHLGLDAERRITGDPSALRRLAAITRLAMRWYFVAAPLATAVLMVAGQYFFRDSTDAVSWRAPWLLLCVVTGINLALAPLWSVLEGANQIRTVYNFRFAEGIVTSVALWAGLVGGAGLWTAVISGAATLAFGVWFLRTRFRRFFASLQAVPWEEGAVSWRNELFPMQWRVAVSWLCGYFVFSLFTPILFKHQGAVVAGQMGMTWSVVSLIGMIPSMWLAPRVPQFGMLIAKGKYEELDRIFWKLTWIMLGIGTLLGVGAWLTIVILYQLDIPLAHRVLPPLPSALFIAAQVIMVSSLAASTYMRAHKQEPLMPLNVLTALATASSTYLLGKTVGAVGVAAGYLGITAVAIPVVFLIFVRSRRDWQRRRFDLPSSAVST